MTRNTRNNIEFIPKEWFVALKEHRQERKTLNHIHTQAVVFSNLVIKLTNLTNIKKTCS